MKVIFFLKNKSFYSVCVCMHAHVCMKEREKGKEGWGGVKLII